MQSIDTGNIGYCIQDTARRHRTLLKDNNTTLSKTGVNSYAREWTAVSSSYSIITMLLIVKSGTSIVGDNG